MSPARIITSQALVVCGVWLFTVLRPVDTFEPNDLPLKFRVIVSVSDDYYFLHRKNENIV